MLTQVASKKTLSSQAKSLVFIYWSPVAKLIYSGRANQAISTDTAQRNNLQQQCKASLHKQSVRCSKKKNSHYVQLTFVTNAFVFS